MITDEEFFDCELRGVTSVLNSVFGNKFENSGIPEHVLQIAAERGTACHKYLEDYQKWFVEDKTDGEPHLGLEYTNYEENFHKFLNERVEILRVLATEQKMINKKLFMKGILDAVWMVKHKDDGREYICLIDFKTSSNLDEWLTNCQLQLYYMMLANGNKKERALAKQITELRCLSLTKTGYRWFKFEIDRDLGKAILKLWTTHFREIAEKEKRRAEKEEKKKKTVMVL